MRSHFFISSARRGSVLTAAASLGTWWLAAPPATTTTECSGAPALYFFDLDGTIVGSPSRAEGQKFFLDFWRKQQREAPATQRPMLCYNTARCIKDYESLRNKTAEEGLALPEPDLLITGDGTEGRWRGQLDQVWDRRIREHWRESGLERRVRAAMDPLDAGLIPNLNDEDNSASLGGEYRDAITVTSAEAADAVVARLRSTFGRDCNVYKVPCGSWIADGSSPDAHMVSALPGLTHKGKAAQYAAHCLGRMAWKQVPGGDCETRDAPWGGEVERIGEWDDNVVAAGDTIGDAPMLWTGVRFVAVGNSSDCLVSNLRASARGSDTHYVATGANAFGVIEGLRHFGAVAASSGSSSSSS